MTASKERRELTGLTFVDSKRKLLGEGFQREIRRYQLPLKFHPQHPLRSVDAGRLLCAFPDQYRPLLAQ
jgi:hypothetical protein